MTSIGFNQSLVDFCLQQYGALEQYVALCRDNGFNLDDDPPAGTSMIIDSSNISDNGLVTYLLKAGKKINTKSPSNSVTNGILTEDGQNILTEDGQNIISE